jgi:hypothetical protein
MGKHHFNIMVSLHRAAKRSLLRRSGVFPTLFDTSERLLSMKRVCYLHLSISRF